MYDYIIVGAGPSGLTLAWILSQYNKKILIIERENTIGGCHRVRRVDGTYFSEHGPRIYCSNAYNFKMIYEDMGGDYNESFVNYDFGMTRIGGMTALQMEIHELFWLVVAYLRLMINEEYGKDQTVNEYIDYYGFSEATKDYLNRLCRLSDGAGSDRYTLNEFLQILNQNFFYKILQPKVANDIGFLHLWKNALEQTGLVDFKLNTELLNINANFNTNLNTNDKNKVISITVKNLSDNQVFDIEGKNFILAIPPTNLVEILLKSSQKKMIDAFGNIDKLKQWEEKSKYLIYVPITFHWKKKFNIVKNWGFTKSDWGLVYIVLSDYMKIIEDESTVVISSCLTIDNQISKETNKTVNDSSIEELKNETLRQLREAIPDLPNPDKIIVSPGFYRDTNENKWKTKDNSFIVTKEGYMKNSQSDIYNNLYSLGTHNGKHHYDFTSIESAVSNAISMANTLVPESKHKYRIQGLISLLDVVRVILLILFIILIFYLYNKFKQQ